MVNIGLTVPMMVIMMLYELCVVISAVLGAEVRENAWDDSVEDAYHCIWISCLFVIFCILTDIIMQTGKFGQPHKFLTYFLSLVLLVSILMNIAGASILTDNSINCNKCEKEDDVKAHTFFIWISPIFISATLFYEKLRQMNLVR